MEVNILILLILALAIIIGSTMGFGDSLVFIPISSLFIDARASIVIMGFWSMALSILNAINYRSFIDKKLLKKYTIPGFIGVILGSLLIIILETRWIEFGLGIFVLSYIVLKLIEIKKVKKNNEEMITLINQRNLNSIPNYLFYSGAFSYSFLAALIGASGPINVVLLERTGYVRESFIGNFAIISVTINSFRLFMYVANNLFPIELLITFIIGFGVLFIVTKIGHKITPKIPKEKFELIILILLAIISIRLIINSIFFY